MDAANSEEHERNERQKKQMYLKEEIVSRGYNKAEFAIYMESKKENGTDIDLWTFEELIQAVAEFQEIQDKEEHQKDPDDEEDLYKYVHPAEVQKLKGRHERVKKHYESDKNANDPRLVEPKSIHNIRDDNSLNKSKDFEAKSKFSNDQGGWEQEEIDLDSIEENKSKEDRNVGLDEVAQKVISEHNKTVEETLEEFFKNDDSEFDIINTTEVQGSKKDHIKIEEEIKSEERKSEIVKIDKIIDSEEVQNIY